VYDKHHAAKATLKGEQDELKETEEETSPPAKTDEEGRGGFGLKGKKGRTPSRKNKKSAKTEGGRAAADKGENMRQKRTEGRASAGPK